jgi:O-antigen/teichoic acid export membrane protein
MMATSPFKDNPGGPSSEGFKEEAIRSAKWALLNNLLPKSLSLILTTILARLLTPDDYGLVGIGILVISLVSMIQQTGFSQALVQRRTCDDDAASVALWLNLSLSVMLYGLAWASAPALAAFYEDPRLIAVLRVLGLQIIISSISTIQSSLMLRGFQYRNLFYIQTASTLAPFLVSIPLVLVGLRYWGLIYGLIAGSFVGVILCWWFTRWRPRTLLDLHIARQLAGFGGFVLLESVLAWMLVSLDNGIVGKVLGTQALGLYAFGFNLAVMVISIPISAITGLTLPLFSRMQEDPAGLRKAYLAGTRLVATYCIPAGVGLALISDPLARLLFGERWAGLGPVLSILSLYAGFGHLWALSGDAFKALGRPDVIPRIYIMVLVIMIPAYLISASYGLIAFTIVRSCVVLVGAVPHTWYAARVMALPRSYLWQCCHTQLVPTALMAASVIALLKALSPAPGSGLDYFTVFFAPVMGLFVYLAALYLVDRTLFSSIRSLIKTSIVMGRAS